jgi:hypothetical protein
VNERTLLFSAPYYHWRYYTGMILFSFGYPGYYNSFPFRSCELLAVDITTPAQPKFASQTALGDGQSWNFSQPFAANDSVYVSYRVVPGYVADPGATTQAAATDADQAEANKHFLKVIDYSDSTNPVVSGSAINIPGELRGLSRQGGLLYTVGAALDLTTGASEDSGAALHVSGFDGVAAHLLDQLALTNCWQPFAISGETVLLLDPQPAQIWKPTPQPDPGTTGGATTTVSGGGALILSGGTFSLTKAGAGTLTLNSSGNATTQTANTLATGTTLNLSGTITLGSVSSIALPIGYNYWGSWDANPNLSSLTAYQVDDDGHFQQKGTLQLAHELSFTQFDGLSVLRSTGRDIRLVDTRDPQHLLDLGTFTLEANGNASLDTAAADITRGLWLPLWTYGVEIVPLTVSTAN